jgi:hypothetical protein
MEIRNSAVSCGTTRRKPAGLPIFEFLISPLGLSILLVACAAPGEPLERKPLVPLAVSDLSVAQAGNDVIVAFTLPRETADHQPLPGAPAIEIYRDFEAAPALPPGTPAAPRVTVRKPALLVTVPSAMVDHYAADGHIRYVDSLKAEDLAEHPDSIAVYSVRTRASVKRVSADSNIAYVYVDPAPDPIEDVKAVVTHSGVDLSWTPPRRTPIGTAPPIVGYRLYRAGSGAPGRGSTSANSGNARRGMEGEFGPVSKIGETESPTYRDTQVELGKTYVYFVRTVVEYPDKTLESADSNSYVLTVVDTSAPSAPQDIVVVLVPAQGGTPAHIELSWAIISETSVAGYDVYRSEQGGVLGTRLNAELLLTPAFRDLNAVPGRRYFYRVTAVDRSGDESPPSEAASGGVPAEGQSTTP